MVKIALLKQDFYDDYSHCSEILHKEKRPHIIVQIDIDGVLYGIPLRSNIKHPHVIWTDQPNFSGLDLSKTVVITDSDKYIDASKKPYINKHEFDVILEIGTIIKLELSKYIKKYKSAKTKQHIKQNKRLCEYSTLQYFEQYI